MYFTTDYVKNKIQKNLRKDSSALQRSASIDSFAEIVWSDSPRPSLDIPRNAVAPFSKRPSASSLYSNCSASSQSAQLNINELYSYGGIGIGGGNAGSAGALSGGVTAGTTSATTGNSRRESLLSPSSTRRNKLSRIINALQDIKNKELKYIKANPTNQATNIRRILHN
ncbi:hypothetical protein DOY81_004404 [Sarcophaga bullata]|nr:hypothetical protein DOY81_004404 [Sarcophaga bullata]